MFTPARRWCDTVGGVTRILVFCGSSPGRRPEYARAARELGGLLAARGIGVVYGGARVGLMGAVADAALAAGGEVIGVIPGGMFPAEIPHEGLSELHVVETMHERKAMMAELSDAVIALPGGTGTLDELFEMFTWSQLGLHRQPIGLLDVEGYWQPLLAFLDHAVEERFLGAAHRGSLLVSAEVETLVDGLGSARPIGDGARPGSPGKWMDAEGRPAIG